jgi:hypothetical protein
VAVSVVESVVASAVGDGLGGGGVGLGLGGGGELLVAALVVGVAAAVVGSGAGAEVAGALVPDVDPLGSSLPDGLLLSPEVVPEGVGLDEVALGDVLALGDELAPGDAVVLGDVVPGEVVLGEVVPGEVVPWVAPGAQVADEPDVVPLCGETGVPDRL